MDMTKIIVAFCDYGNEIKNSTFHLHSTFMCFVWVSQHTAAISLYRVKMFSIIETYCVLLCGTIYPATSHQWRTQEFFFGGGSTNSVEDRGQNGDLGAAAP
jgi:hypothetical protein